MYPASIVPGSSPAGDSQFFLQTFSLSHSLNEYPMFIIIIVCGRAIGNDSDVNVRVHGCSMAQGSGIPNCSTCSLAGPH